ncbi:RNA 2',3'-cyclic 3'-phosphodiesterase [Ensifer sp. WSM1721]|uniref:2'-5' RNA ligase family protein n=1 Tax=Ensifer sp. WSM1721 TaxID=1041159 RepID=UPI00047CB7D2|nr:2'-5' RNA ligase family protein [Ensifer sp. WSM1721]
MRSYQLSLNLGPSPAPRAVDVYYFAVLPEEEAAEEALELARWDQQKYGLSGKICDRHRLHVSLAKIREGRGLSEAVGAYAADLGSRVKAAAFQVRFDRLISVGHGNRHPRILTCNSVVHGVNALVRQITGLPHISAETIPHMTLYYGDREAPRVDLPRPIAWTVHDFALVHTRRGCGDFAIIDRWSLSL